MGDRGRGSRKARDVTRRDAAGYVFEELSLQEWKSKRAGRAALWVTQPYKGIRRVEAEDLQAHTRTHTQRHARARLTV